MITFLLVAAAVAFLFWPKGVTNPIPQFSAVEDLLRPPAAAASQPAPASRDAIDSLLEVRDRLAATDALDEDSAKAVDVLWLDLLHGSQRK
jgi:hypothetical protein